MPVPHPPSILIPKMIGLGGGAFGSWSGPEGSALLIGLSALSEETPESSLDLSTARVHSNPVQSVNQRVGPH